MSEISEISSSFPITPIEWTPPLPLALAVPETNLSEAEFLKRAEHSFSGALMCCKIVSDYEKLVGKQTAISKLEIDAKMQHMEKNVNHKADLIEEDAMLRTSQRNWGILGSFASYTNSAATFALAMHLGPTYPAAMLGVSATATFVNQLIQDTCGWGSLSSQWASNHEEQQLWAERIGNSLSCLGIGLGALGGYQAHTTGLWDWLNWNNGINVVQGASSLVKGTTMIATSLNDYNITQLQHKIKSADIEIEKMRFENEEQTSMLQSITKSVANIIDEMKERIKEEEVTI